MTKSRNRANGEGSIYPYKNGYAAYAWVTTPSGLRRRKYVYGKTRDYVHQKWIKLQQQAAQGPLPTKTPKVGAYLDYWLREVVTPNVAPLTAKTYETLVRRHIAPGLGSKNLARLSTRDAQQWINRVARTCQCCAQGKDVARPSDKQRCCALSNCCGQRLSPRTQRDTRACLRRALACAIDDELITRNIAKSIKLPTARRKKGKRWTTEQARRFLASAKVDNDPLYAAYVLVVVEGMRKGEALGLPYDAVDFEQQKVEIGYQLQRVGGQLLHRETKTEESDSQLPFPAIVGTALRARLVQRDRDKQAAADAWQEHGLMFTTKYGTPIEPRNFNRSWDRRIIKAGVPKITVHDGRRTCGSLLADLDVHPRVAMAILRHAQFAITMEIYTEVSDEATREGLKKLGESLQ
ncbi:MAG: tyrosine-type recombinase/integrase [Actinophytocola sp.]|nr:tyrosine-type recombinase/integrase [Actinophytocola sp.]